MKKTILAVILILFASFSVYGQNSSPIDLVLVLDTSSGMSSSYENVNNYITGAFLSEYLRVGDTFHLIAFSGSPRLDVARRIKDVGDVETIIGRMLLQYPVENGNNAGAALTYAERYISTLPARPKKIVLVSIGGSDTSSIVSSSRQRLGSNATIDFVQVIPGQALTNLPNSGRPAAVRAQTTTPQSTTTTTPPPARPTSPAGTTPTQNTVTTPTPSQQQTTTPSTSRTTPDTATRTDTTSQDRQGTSSGVGTTTTGTPGASSSEQTGQGQTAVTEGQQTQDSETGITGGTQTEGYPEPEKTRDRSSNGGSLVSSMPLMIGIVVLALIVLGLIIFAASRRLGSSPNRVMAQVASSGSGRREDAQFVDHSKDLSSYAASQNKQRTTPYTDRPVKPDANKPVVINPSGPLLLNLFVEDQNTAIGKRNIHSLKSGYSLSVGGGKSDYLIFLVPIPPHIGEIRRDGSQCTFIPRKPKYFPDIGSSEVRDCINKTIRVVSDRNYEMRFRFEMYEDPLIALNRTLMSIRVPG